MWKARVDIGAISMREEVSRGEGSRADRQQLEGREQRGFIFRTESVESPMRPRTERKQERRFDSDNRYAWIPREAIR